MKGKTMYIVYDNIKSEILTRVKIDFSYSRSPSSHEAIFLEKQEALDFALGKLDANVYAREGDIVVINSHSSCLYGQGRTIRPSTNNTGDKP